MTDQFTSGAGCSLTATAADGDGVLVVLPRNHPPITTAAGVAPSTATPPSRTPEADLRIATHEVGHQLVRMLAGHRNVFATIEPAQTFSGLCWSGDPEIRNTFDRVASETDALVYSDKVCALMPPPGRSRDCAEPIIAVVHEDIIVAMAGLAAELLLCGPPSTPLGHSSDLINARAAARQICSNDVSAEGLVTWGLTEATERLRPYKVVIQHLADALVAKRTLDDPTEIDRLIAQGIALQSLADARECRAAWNRTVDAAKATTANFERTR